MKLEFHDFKPVSLNQWYSGKHWSDRSALKKEWRWRLKHALQNCVREEFEHPVTITLTAWLKRPIDPSNCAIYLKLIEDGLVAEGVLKDDSW